MKVILDASIPPNVAKRYGWAIRHNARESGERPWFELALTPPLEGMVSFTSKLAEIEQSALHVRFFKSPLKTGRKSRIDGLHSSWLSGWTVRMDHNDARLASEFIEKHYG
jgi:hypothetical protein